VVRPVATGEQVSLSINPYHLGFTLWEEIIEQSGIEAARRIMREDDDFSFLRNHLTREVATEMGLFRYQRRQNGPIKVIGGDVDELHESLLLDKYNFGAPRVSIAEVRNDGTLILEHDAQLDGRGLDAERSVKVLEYIKRVWRRPVLLNTLDAAAKAVEYSSETATA
jgi:stage V sporulation protein R